MRAALAVFGLGLLTGCAPKVVVSPHASDDLEDGKHAQETTVKVAEEPARPEAPVGTGVRSGTIERTALIAVLDKGPGELLHQFEVTARMDGDRFVGWQLVQLLDLHGALEGIDVAPGDVLLAVNGKSISRPDQLFAVWDSLRTANEVDAELWRGQAKLELKFAIEPRL